MPWGKDLRCETVFSNRNLKYLFVDGLLPRTQKKTHYFLSPHPGSDYHTVLRQAQAVGDWVRVARWPATTAPSAGKSKKTEFLRGVKTMSAETSSREDESIRGEEAVREVMAFTRSYTQSRNQSTNPSKSLSSPFSSHQATTPATRENTIARSDVLTPSNDLVYYTMPLAPGRPPQCLLRIGSHAVCSRALEANRDWLLQV